MPRGTTVPGEISDRIAKLLSSLLAYTEMTRSQLGQKAGIAEGRVSELLNAKKPWYLEDVERISDALDLDPWRVLLLAEHTVRASREDFDLVAKRLPREPDGNDEQFM